MEIYDIANAMQERPKFGGLDIPKRVAGLTAVVARLYSLKGMGGNGAKLEGEITLAVTELERECAKKYPFFSMSEIRLALEAGVKGELTDEPTYLNAANYCKWLALYRKSAARLEAAQAVDSNLKIAAPAYQLDAGTVASRNEVAMEDLFAQVQEEVKATGKIGAAHFSPTLAALYDWLRAKGQMERPSQAMIQDAMAKAANAAKSEKTLTVKEAIERAAGTVYAGAKRYLLEDYLKTL